MKKPGAEGVTSEVKSSILRGFGIEKLTKVQEKSIPHVLSGDECLIIAETGSGKTEAVMIPIIQKMMKKPLECIYITPLRALNRDIFTRLEKTCEKHGIRVETRHGDTPQRIRQEQLKDPPEMLITTPETFQILLVAPKFKQFLANTRFVVIDEIHELMDNKRGPQLACAVARLRRRVDFKLYGLSATVSEPETVSKYFWKGGARVVRGKDEKAREVVVEVPEYTRKDLETSQASGISLASVSKLRRIQEISKGTSTLIFTNTRSAAEILTSRLGKLIDINVHHGSLSKEHRKVVESDFKKGLLNKVVATSSLELGIDVGHVEQVIQYGSPRRVDSFTQRVGRSGHFIERVSKGFIISDLAEAAESAVIARRVVSGELEPMETVDKPLDILAHQIVGFVLEDFIQNKDDVYQFFTGVWPFRNLARDEFNKVMGLVEQLGYIRQGNGKYNRRMRAWKYYYRNISTIPDRERFHLIEHESGKHVAVLDAEFVEELKLGERFVVAGTSWSVVNIDAGRIYAVRTGETSEVATWAGEVIPVDYGVAQEIPEAINFPEKYPYEEKTSRKIRKLGKYSGKTRVEQHNDLTVIITWAGTKVNNTLAHVIGSFLSSQFGENVATRSDEFGVVVKGAPARGIVEKIDSRYVEKTLRKTAGNSQKFRNSFLDVAKRFGAVEKRPFRGISPKRFVELWSGTVIEDEALREYLRKKMDIPATAEFLAGIGEPEVGKISPIGKYMVEKFYPEVFEASRPKKHILDAMKVGLMNKKLPLACMYCRTHLGQFSVASAPEECPSCSSKFLGVLRDPQLLRKKTLTVKNKRELKSAKLSGNLFLSYGGKALLTQAGRGVGPAAAARILRKSANEAELLENIYESEKLYARTRPFWD